MKRIVQRPDAGAVLSSLRAIGYSFNTAIADIIDNSIAADANNVAIYLHSIPEPTVVILDDGFGMTSGELLAAMRHGGTGPTTVRHESDLGRYGLGLKTASLSQCRRLTVVSLRDGELSAARWDLDEVLDANEWVLGVLTRDEIEALAHVGNLIAQSHGTLVLWEKFDRALAGESVPKGALARLVDESRDHLALTFHRFLAGDSRHKAIRISINGLELVPVDPFLRSNPRTESLPSETFKIRGQSISVQPFILPHLSDIKPEEVRTPGGVDGLRQSQGFYVYRNRRLIVAGTWFRLIRLDELTKLARVRIDIPNSLDELWKLDVKKSTANPPEEVRIRLRRIIDRIADRSTNVFKNRKRRAGSSAITHMWERYRVRRGVTYAINRDHPSVTVVRSLLYKVNFSELEHLLRAIELSLPADSIYSDMATDSAVEPPSAEISDDLKQFALALLARVHGVARKRLLTSLLTLEPFSMYPSATRKLIEELSA